MLVTDSIMLLNSPGTDRDRPHFLTPVKPNPKQPLFVFLPGMDGTGELLQTQVARLDPHFDIRCLAIPPEDASNWEELAGHVIKAIAIEREKMPHPAVYLCGESFGGCLAMKVAVRAPDAFDRLILVNPASSFRERPYLGWASRAVGWMPSFLYPASNLTILPILSAMGRMTKEARRALVRAMKSVPPQTVIWRMSLLEEFAIDLNALGRLSQPVLLVASQSDRLLPSVEEAQRLRSAFVDARLHVLPDSGHTSLLEADVHLYEILKSEDFLDLSLG